MQIKKIEKFFNKQIKLLIKNRKILLGVLLVALLIVFNPMVEGLESDSFWCKYFSWFPGVSCDEPDATPATPAATPAATTKNGSSNSTSASTPEEEEEPELSDCTCNANCQLKNNSEDRVLNEECKVPEGIEDVNSVSGYCDKCENNMNPKLKWTEYAHPN